MVVAAAVRARTADAAPENSDQRIQEFQAAALPRARRQSAAARIGAAAGPGCPSASASVQQYRVSTSMSSPLIISAAVAHVSRRGKPPTIASIAARNTRPQAAWVLVASTATWS
ncbi:hypothetical protein ACWCQW_51470 [Streptomyces mirabilis]